MIPLRVGDVLEGFCGGCFGRDSYEDKRVEAIGTDWVVVRGGDLGLAHGNGPSFYYGDPEVLLQYRIDPTRMAGVPDDDGQYLCVCAADGSRSPCSCYPGQA